MIKRILDFTDGPAFWSSTALAIIITHILTTGITGTTMIMIGYLVVLRYLARICELLEEKKEV